MKNLEKDSDIWENFKKGDKSALSYVYFQNFQSLFQYGIRFKDDPEFIKDCIQDLFFRLIQAGENLGPTDNIRFYLFHALKNGIYKEIEKSKRNELIDFSSLKFDGSFALEEELVEKENISNQEIALLKALKELSDRQREIIYLRYECGMEYEQICDLMQLKSDSARKLVFRAIRSLRKAMQDSKQFPVLFFFHFSKKYVL
jgi:RNA polymerase sigma factor (sigma-70 family)